MALLSLVLADREVLLTIMNIILVLFTGLMLPQVLKLAPTMWGLERLQYHYGLGRQIGDPVVLLLLSLLISMLMKLILILMLEKLDQIPNGLFV